MNTLILELIELLCEWIIILMLLISIHLVYNTFRKKLKHLLTNKNITTNIFRIHPHDSVMCGCFCIGFSNFVFKGKTLTEYTNLFLPYAFQKSDDIILKYFMNNT